MSAPDEAPRKRRSLYRRPVAPPPPPSLAAYTPDAARAKLPIVVGQLCLEYGCPSTSFRSLDPVTELIEALASESAKFYETARAMRTLRARFRTWDEARDADRPAVAAAIAAVPRAAAKARRIQETLHAITDRRNGVLELDFLARWSAADAREWLESLPHVSPNAAAAALLLSRLRKRALPVDPNHHRVAERLALVPPKLQLPAAQQLLESHVPPQWRAPKVFDMQAVMTEHGVRCCYLRDPACRRCPVLELCPTGRSRVG